MSSRATFKDDVAIHTQTSQLLSEQIIRLSLVDAIYLGIRDNRNIRSAYMQRVTQKFDFRVSENMFQPKLSIKGLYRADNGSDNRANSMMLSPTTRVLGKYGTQLSLSWLSQQNGSKQNGRMVSDGLDLAVIQPLMRGAGRDVTMAPLKLARISEQKNHLQLKANVIQTISEIIGTYRGLLKSQEQLSIATKALERARSLLEVNRMLIHTGRMAKIEIVQTEADIATQELGVQEAQNQVDTHRLSLLRLLALDLSTPISASDSLTISRVQIDQHQAMQTAISQQPQYLTSLLGTRQAELNLLMAQDQERWDISLVGGTTLVSDRGGSGNGSSKRKSNGYAGLQLEIPIGDLSTRQAKVRARVDAETQALQESEARQTLERNVDDAVRSLKVRWRQFEIALRVDDLSRRKLAIERDKLNIGRSSNFQVLSFEADMRNAQNSLLSAKIAYLDAQTHLDQVLGMTLESWSISLNDY